MFSFSSAKYPCDNNQLSSRPVPIIPSVNISFLCKLNIISLLKNKISKFLDHTLTLSEDHQIFLVLKNERKMIDWGVLGPVLTQVFCFFLQHQTLAVSVSVIQRLFSLEYTTGKKNRVTLPGACGTTYRR